MNHSDSRDSAGQSENLRTRIAAALERNLAEQLFSDLPDRYYKWIGYDELADAVIRELVELRRIDQVREVCVASLNLDRTAPGEVFCDRAWLADSILNILNGMTDE